MQTSAGYHFYADHQGCPRKWFIRHLLKLTRSEGSLPASLLFGTAVHAVLLEHYQAPRGLPLPTLMEIWAIEFTKEEAVYLRSGATWDPNPKSDQDRDHLLKVRGPNAIHNWYETIGKDLHQFYRFIEGEQEHSFTLPNGMGITYRTDRLIESIPTGRRFIIDTKTTGRSLIGMAESVAAEDQSTTYLLGAEINGHDVDAVIPEVLYSRGSVYKSAWPFEISRSPRELRDWEHSLMSLTEETSQKAEAWKTGNYTPGALFPRCPGGCSYTGKCSHPTICRTPPTDGTIPQGYKRSE